MFFPRMSQRGKERFTNLMSTWVTVNPPLWIHAYRLWYQGEEIDKERRAQKLQKAEQLRKELESNPALCEEMELEAWRKVEARRDYAFHQMEDMELHRIFGLGSIFRELPAHKVFWAWRKQALSELQQLREAERSSREKLAQDPDALLAAKKDMIRHFTSTDEREEDDPASWSTYSEYHTRILPITVPAEFARTHRNEQARLQ